MFKVPLCLNVIAANEQQEMLEDMGIAVNDDPYNDPTFAVCFYKVDAVMPDERSTFAKPLTCIVCGELVYLVKIEITDLIGMIAEVSQ